MIIENDPCPEIAIGATGTCLHCGVGVTLARTGKYTRKWLPDPRKPRQWKCSKRPNDDGYEGHAPVDAIYPATITQTPPPK